MPMKVRARVVFEGLVQGVFFRMNTKHCADRLNLSGWVRNLSDGRVEAVFEGDDEKVREAIDWCATRQPYAKVDSKEVEFAQFTGEFDGFMIRR
ncbi:MAG: acylphosphatase [Thermoplasmata archaeon]|jgi:acylphosphatase|nr:acylphosphatase [Thermoplasmata archaeon]